MLELLTKPWQWYVSGPLIGLMVPILLILGNKSFGISSSLRHFCAACIPTKVKFFDYNWKAEAWNLIFVLGVVAGGFIAGILLKNPELVQISENTIKDLQGYGITDFSNLYPTEIFNFQNLLSVNGFLFMIIGGFLVGFGTRYANGCTSGHSIMGLSNLQFSSLVATICFFAGGLIMSWFIIPLLF